jgi:hypothetical protein
MKQYRRWQNLYTTLRPGEQGYLPTAIEYDEFQHWLKKQDSGYFSDVFEDVAEHIKPPNPTESPVGFVCRHPMHPAAAGQLRARCHVCLIDMHLNYTKVLEKALKDAGGRPPSCTLASSPYQDCIYRAWLHQKLETLHRLFELEACADEESKWQSKLPDTAGEDIRTADAALELYWTEVGACKANQPSTPLKKKKAVEFTPDTEFGLRRPQPYYWKKSPRYQPGKYTLPQDEHEEDFVSEDSEDYSHPILLECKAETYPFAGDDDSSRRVRISDEDDDEPSSTRTRIDEFFRFGQTEKQGDEIPNADADCEEIDDLSDDDEDSDWEDMESDDDTLEDGDYIFFDVEEDASFVVFGED